MATTSHRMIDGSMLTVSSPDQNLGKPVSTFGWIHVGSLGESHPFMVQPPGYSYTLEQNMPPMPDGTDVGAVSEFTIKSGVLRVADVMIPTSYGVERHMTIGAWEGQQGCVWTSRSNSSVPEMIAMFDSLDFVSSTEGVYFLSDLDPAPRPPRCIKELTDFAVVTFAPLTQDAISKLPSDPGEIVAHGELYRVSDDMKALMLVTSSTVVTVDPLDRDEVVADEFASKVAELDAMWQAPQ